jgi:hypothetical protein
MSKNLLCTVASAGNCPCYNLNYTGRKIAVDYFVIRMDEKYRCKVCGGKDAQGIEGDCIEIEKLNLLSKLANK